MPSLSKIDYIALLCLVAGIFTFEIFRALPGIGLGLLLLSALTRLKHYKEFLKHGYFLIPSLIYLLYVANLLLFKTDSPDKVGELLVFYLPYFTLPFSLALIPPIDRRKLYGLYLFFVLLCTLCALGTLVNFAFHYKEIIASYEHSKVMPTPVNHVRFSLLISFAFFAALYFYQERFTLRYAWERPVLLSIAIFLFTYSHILSVRSGLLTLYIGLFISTLWLTIRYKRYKLLAFVSAALILIPVLSFLLVPTFTNKVKNTVEDLRQVNVKGSGAHYSVSGRVVSYQVAKEIMKHNLWTGCGSANLKEEVHAVYERDFPEIVNNGVGVLMPHNQFLYILSGMGIIGLAVFLCCFYFPLFVKKANTFPLLRMHYLILSISFLFEATMETQTGSMFALTFVFLPLLYLKDQHD